MTLINPLNVQGNPPRAIFETRAIENRPESEAEGQVIYRDVDYVTLRQLGSKESVEREAVPWLESLKSNTGWSREWIDTVKRQYAAFKEGKEFRPDGTDVKLWPTATKAEVQMLLNLNIRTVEELASANEETVQRLSMGGRALKMRAQAWIDSAKNTGIAAQELTVLRSRVEEQDALIVEMRANAALQAKQMEKILAKFATEEDPFGN